MKKAALVARLLLGLMFLVFGLNGFFNFLPALELGPEAGAFFGGLMDAGYFIPFLKTFETLSGVMLLAGVGVPLALLFLAPIVSNILMFQIFLDPANIMPGLVALVLGLFVAYAYRDSFAGVLNFGAKPAGE